MNIHKEENFIYEDFERIIRRCYMENMKKRKYALNRKELHERVLQSLRYHIEHMHDEEKFLRRKGIDTICSSVLTDQVEIPNKKEIESMLAFADSHFT